LLSAEELMSLIQQLPPVYRLVFNMYNIEGYDHNEIAEQLGITPSTFRANLAKARAKLQLWVKQLTEYHHQNTGKHVFAAF
jgi:RNA polymerase sigma-70 factor (ECF subfamily)